MFRGSNTSLYSTLDALAVENLEQAIHLTNLGYYEKAISIFEHKLSEFRHIPVVVIERADLHFQRYQFGVTRGVLEDGLRYSSDVDLDRAEYRLILLYLAVIRCYSKGDLRSAVRDGSDAGVVDRCRSGEVYRYSSELFAVAETRPVPSFSCVN